MPSTALEHRHTGWFCCHDTKVEMAERLSRGECVIRLDYPTPNRAWCILHNREEDPGHAFDTGRLDTLD